MAKEVIQANSKSMSNNTKNIQNIRQLLVPAEQVLRTKTV